jgi:hypothetical protein
VLRGTLRRHAAIQSQTVMLSFSTVSLSATLAPRAVLAPQHLALCVSLLTNQENMDTSQAADSDRLRETRRGSGSLFSKSIKVFGVWGPGRNDG